MSLTRRLVLLLFLLVAAGCRKSDPSVDWITLDFPYGETRLHVERDGDARLFYGALPQSQGIDDDTFDIDTLYEELQTRIHEVVPAENRPLNQPFGSVAFGYTDGSSEEYLIYDGDYAEGLFEIARGKIVGEFP